MYDVCIIVKYITEPVFFRNNTGLLIYLKKMILIK